MRSKFRFVCHLLLLVWSIAVSSAQSVDVRRAEDITRKVGWPWQAPFETRSGKTVDGEAKTSITAGPGREVTVSFDSQGEVRGAYRALLPPKRTEEAWALASDAAVLERVNELQAALGLAQYRVSHLKRGATNSTMDVSSEMATVYLTDAPAGSSVGEGAGNFVRFDLWASDGSVSSVRFQAGWSYGPSSVKISVVQATSVALDFLSKAGVSVDRTLLSAEPGVPLYIAASHPEDSTESGLRYRREKQSRLAYAISYDSDRLGIYVDANTGEVLATSAAGTSGSAGESTANEHAAKVSSATQKRPPTIPIAVGVGFFLLVSIVLLIRKAVQAGRNDSVK
jgi:hypothetical protein